MAFDYDLFVIGAGSGGVRAARIAAQYGAKVAIAEEYRVGGTCVIRGCVPKKLFHYAAQYAEHFEEAKGYGWAGQENAQFSWEKLIAAKDREIARLNGLYIKGLQNAGVEIFETRAELTGPHDIRLVAEERTVTAANILIATGATPFVPHNIPGAAYAITSNEAFHLKSLPASIAIIGGGYIALEFASIFNGLGVDTHVLYRGPQILRGFDDELRDVLAEELAAKGVTIHTRADVDRIERCGPERGGYIVHTRKGEELAVAEVMYATGRMPNTFDLGLDRAGVELGGNDAIKVDDYNRTSVPHIFAVGDVTDRGVQLTPFAIREGHALAERLFGGKDTPPVSTENIATAVFTSPELGAVGLTEQQARERPGDIDVHAARFRPMKHTLSGSAEKVFYKLIVERKTNKVVGAHLIAPEAGELIQLMGVLMQAGATKAHFDATLAVHPTAAEELVLMKTPRP